MILIMIIFFKVKDPCKQPKVIGYVEKGTYVGAQQNNTDQCY